MNSNTSSSEMVGDSVSHTVTVVLYILTVVLGIPGNSVVIYVAVRKVKTKVTNVWLVNLAVADLIFCITRIFSVVEKLQSNNWIFGLFLCKFDSFFKYTNMYCSVFILAVISLDQALCVKRPLLIRTRRTLFVARVVAACVWVTAIILSSPVFYYQQIKTENNKTKCSLSEEQGKNTKTSLHCVRFLFGFLLPFMVILVCSIVAGLGIKRTRLLSKARPLRILVTLVIAFFLCWAPYHCVKLVTIAVDSIETTSRLKSWSRVISGIAYFNSCLNPILYYCIGVNFRDTCKERLTNVFGRAMADVMDNE